jgi:hypothetical protein
MRPAGAVVLVVLVVAGCGSNHARRNAVNQYFDRVDAAQTPIRLQAAPIEKAFQRFSALRNTTTEIRALVHAQAVIEGVRVKIERVQPPADVRPLHTDLIHLYDLQVGVAGELVEMTRFVPRYDAELAPLKPAHAALVGDLTAAKGWQKIAKAFERYRLSLAGVLARLDRLSAPATLRPAFMAEQTALGHSVALCASIEKSLAKHDAKKTATAIGALSSVGTEKSVARAQRDQIAAAKAYNARLARIASLSAKIGRERDKLVGQLG